MELENRDFRAMIYYDLKRGLSFQESYESLHKAFGPIAPAKSTVSKWYREFGFGREHLRDINTPGRPTSSATEENATRVKRYLYNNMIFFFLKTSFQTNMALP